MKSQLSEKYEAQLVSSETEFPLRADSSCRGTESVYTLSYSLLQRDAPLLPVDKHQAQCCQSNWPPNPTPPKAPGPSHRSSMLTEAWTLSPDSLPFTLLQCMDKQLWRKKKKKHVRSYSTLSET